MPTPFSLPVSGQYEWPVSPTLPRRFWAKVDRGLDADCWPWLAFCNPSGYGMIRNGSHMALAPRVSWVMAHGPIADGLQVRHSCDNPPCVNPAHLSLGSNTDNVQDKVSRGRSSFAQPRKRGERHPLAKLTAVQVAKIRAADHVTGRALAEMYGVSPALICRIRKRKVWAHER